MYKRISAAAFILLGLASMFFSCKKDEFDTDNGVKLGFSQDTVLFDTVFTTVGSSTQIFSVYNTQNKAVKISSLRLATGNNSNFRLNVDGVPGKSFTDVEIGANDSIFIFVEVTVDPNSQNSPLVINDSILFETNGNLQYVDLVAWGQDAYFHRPPPNAPDYPFFFLNGSETWTNDKPHVIYGFAIVDSLATLTINAGTNVYFHPGSALIVANRGSLHIDGTLQNIVTIQGDRLGQDYADIPGQWDRIWLTAGSKNSYIRNAIIKNGNIGLQVDSFATTNDSTLYLENTIVKTMTTNALLLEGTVASAYNCVFANCGQQVVAIQYGGNYKFYQCTLADFWSNSTRTEPALSLNNYYLNGPRALSAIFGNTIVYGINDQEVGYDSIPFPNYFNVLFDHAMLKVENTFSTSTPFHYNGIVRASNNSNSPGFADPDENNYRLDSLNSSAINTGDANVQNAFPAVLNTDIIGVTRPQRGVPDLGAYERE